MYRDSVLKSIIEGCVEREIGRVRPRMGYIQRIPNDAGMQIYRVKGFEFGRRNAMSCSQPTERLETKRKKR